MGELYPTFRGKRDPVKVSWEFFAAPMACRSSWARDRTCTTAATQATAVKMPDP